MWTLTSAVLAQTNRYDFLYTIGGNKVYEVDCLCFGKMFMHSVRRWNCSWLCPRADGNLHCRGNKVDEFVSLNQVYSSKIPASSINPGTGEVQWRHRSNWEVIFFYDENLEKPRGCSLTTGQLCSSKGFSFLWMDTAEWTLPVSVTLAEVNTDIREFQVKWTHNDSWTW